MGVNNVRPDILELFSIGLDLLTLFLLPVLGKCVGYNKGEASGGISVHLRHKLVHSTREALHPVSSHENGERIQNSP